MPEVLSLPTFTPVPRAKHRHNGWKPEVQRAFIEALAETGSVRAACRRVGRADHGAYLLRRHPDAGEFRAAWDAALDLGIRRLEDAAMDRALYGTEETIHYHGEHVATRRRYNERLVMFMLRNRAPERFAEGRPKRLNAVDEMEFKRLKKQWHEEWQRAQAIAHDAQYDRDGQDFLAKIQAMHRSWYCHMSPATRAAYRAFRAAEDEDARTRHAWMDADDAEPLSVAETEYEEWFGAGRDRRAQAAKLVDMRAWEGAEDYGETPTSPASSPRT